MSKPTKKVRDKWRVKEWYSVFTPSYFGEQNVANIPCEDPKKLVGRVVETTLYDITNDFSHQSTKLYFLVVSVAGDRADTILKSPRNGRVEYRLVEPGEVIPAGGNVVTLLDVLDVYMTFFLPTSEAGKVAVGADARIILDVRRDLPIPAKVSFVSPIAQFTPKEVETRSEREKLMFRVRVRIDPELLKPFADRVKTGLPGVGYVKLNTSAQWPDWLKTPRDKGLPRPRPEDIR